MATVFSLACLRGIERELVINTTLRKRFGIGAKNRASVSLVIKEANGVKSDPLLEPACICAWPTTRPTI